MCSKKIFDSLRMLPDLLEGMSNGKPINGEDCINAITAEFINLKKRGGKIAIIGNGGSSAIALHISNDLIGRFGVYATALNEQPAMTAISNDFGYGHIYSNQLESFSTENDLVVAVSSSGESENIINAVGKVENKCRVITLSGFSADNKLRRLGQCSVYVPFNDYGSVEIAHLSILHAGVWEAIKSYGIKS